MTSRRNKYYTSSLGVLASLAMLASVGVAQAQEKTDSDKRLDAVEQKMDTMQQRMDGVDTKLDALIGLITAQQEAKQEEAKTAGSSAQKTEEPEETTPPAANLRGSSLLLDLYLIPAGNEREWDPKTLLPTTSIFPSASEIVKAPQRFEWKAFRDARSMQRFANPTDKRVALHWNGLIFIPESGQHVFSSEIGVANNSHTRTCLTVLMIDDRELIRSISRGDRAGSRSSQEQNSIRLEKGLHKFSLWGLCSDQDAKYEQVVFLVNIHCHNCEQKVKKNIAYEKGVKDLATDLDKQLVTIKYRTDKTDKAKLKKAIEKLGYTCEEVK